MKKHTSFILFGVLLILAVVSGCGKKQTSTPVTASPTPTAEAPSSGKETDSNSLQEGNSFPRSPFLTKSSDQLPADSRLGWGLGGHYIWNDLKDSESVQHWLRILNNFGIKRLDTSIQEGEEPIIWDRPEFEVFPAYDFFIDGLNDKGIAVNYIIHFWDKEGHDKGELLDTPRFKSEEQIQDFLEYVRFIVGHFKGRVQYYTLWSEPGACGGSGIKCIKPLDYIELARRTIPVIHEEDPEAKVVTAKNVLYFDREYLFTVIQSDVISMFDGISWHGIYDPAPNSAFYGNYYYEYPTIVEEIRQTAYAHGFDGEFWGTEITWCSDEFPSCHAPDQPWEMSKTDKIAAKYDARSFVMHLGMNVGVGWGGLESPEQPWSYPTVQRLNTLMNGSGPIQPDAKIENEPPDTATYAFTLSNGDMLFAFWMDGVATNDDQGLTITLTFNGQSAQTVTGIDVLYGFEQELITVVENGNLILRGLQIRDYPIFVRLTD